MTDSPSPQPADSRPARQDLDRALAHGIAWTGGAKWLSQLVRWGSTLAIVRLLTPADYGLMGMAMVYLGLVQLVNEFGLSSAIVQQKEITEEQLAGLGGLSFAIGAGLFLLSLAAAPLLGLFFGDPQVVPVIRVLAFNFVLRAAQVVPRGLLNRELKFRVLAGIDAAEAISQALVALALAAFGLGYWALVGGSLGAATVATAFAVMARPHRVAWPRALGRLKEAVGLGANIAVSRIGWYVYSNADFATVGKLLGRTVLGAYTFGWTLANIPVERVSALVGRVTPAIFASVQDDPPALRRYLFSITEALAVFTFPASVGMALVADEFVMVVLGPQWGPAVMPLRLLSLYGAMRSVTTLLPDVLVAIGQAKRNAQASIVMAIVLPLMFIAGAKLAGTTGVAWAWLIGYPAIVIPYYGLVALRAMGSNLAAYGRALWPATSGCLAMAAAILGLRPLTHGLPAPVRLGILVAAGALAYAGALFLLHRPRIRTFVDTMKQVRAKKPPRAVPPAEPDAHSKDVA